MSNNRFNKLSNMPAKQKVIAVIAVIIVAVVIWQVAGLFGGGTPAPAPAPVAVKSTTPGQNMSSNIPTNNTNNSMSGGAAPSAPVANNNAVTEMVSTNQQSPTEQMIKQQEKDQVGYLDSLNKLQNLKVEREIAETSQAIASAKLATATAERNMSDLLTKASQQVSLADYLNKLAESSPTQTSTTTTVVTPEIQYVVVSVVRQFDKWTAVLGAQGKLYIVKVGDTLPGSQDAKIIAINDNGVTYLKNKEKNTIQLLTTVQPGIDPSSNTSSSSVNQGPPPRSSLESSAPSTAPIPSIGS
ncbi:MAG: hypothetical protein SFW66_04470 [Gammaproteobacteria bacterium]|nr:hypothetical protein [Gammaproteobacteria bacterium]